MNSLRQYNQRAQQSQLANCPHKNIVEYELSELDQADFCHRLELGLYDTNNLDSFGDFSMNFLTPSIRGNRAKSMLTTTRATKNVQSTASNDDEPWSPTQPQDQTTSQEGDQLSVLKPRSNTRGRIKTQKFAAPAVFRNCSDCGCFYINQEIVSVKPRQYCFRAEILPAQLICAFFEMQEIKDKVTRREDLDSSLFGQNMYLNGRKRIIDGVYKMGVKFRQARETIHIAIEMIDQFYLTVSQEMTAKTFKESLMHPAAVILHQLTVLLIASKYDEIDDNIVTIHDLREYVQKQVQLQQRRDQSLLPSFDQIVECERKLLVFFKWDLKFVLPLHIVRAYLANGVLFSNEFCEMQQQAIKNPQMYEEIQKLKVEWSRNITTESLSISDLIISKGNVTYRCESSSDIAASIIYLARKNILEADSPTGKSCVPQIWPQELVMITRCTESKAKRILVDILRPLEQTIKSQTQSQSQRQLSTILQNQSLKTSNSQPGPPSTRVVAKINPFATTASNPSIISDALEPNAAKKKKISSGNKLKTQQSHSVALSQQNNLAGAQAYNSSSIAEVNSKGFSLSEFVKAGATEDTISSNGMDHNMMQQSLQLQPGRTARAQTIKCHLKSQVELIEEVVLTKSGGEQIKIPPHNTASMIEIANPLNKANKAQTQRQLQLSQHQGSSIGNNSEKTQFRSVLSQGKKLTKDGGSTTIKNQLQTTLSSENRSVSGQRYSNINSYQNQKNINTNYQLSQAGAKQQKQLRPNQKSSNPSLPRLVAAGGVRNLEITLGRASASVLNPGQSNISSFPANSMNDAVSCNTLDEKENADGLPLVMEVDMIEKTTNQQEAHVYELQQKSSSLDKKPNIKHQADLKSKKLSTKSKYLEVKRAQMAKKRIINSKTTKNAESFNTNHTQSIHELNKFTNPQQQQHPYLTKNASTHQMLTKKSHASSQDIGNSAAPAPAATSRPEQKASSSSVVSQPSNEYYSVRPKMIEHVNQLALHNDIIRSSSIEYEATQTHTSDASSSLIPTEYPRNSARRWTTRVPNQSSNCKRLIPGVTHQQHQQQPQITTPIVNSVSLNSSSKGASLATNTNSGTTGKQNQLTQQQVQFLMRQQQSQERKQKRSIGPNGNTVSTLNIERNQSSSNGGQTIHLTGSGNFHEVKSSDYMLESSLGSQGLQQLSMCDKPATKTSVAASKLPSIDRKSSSTTHALQGNFDFSAAVERFSGKPVASTKHVSAQQIKYFTKASGAQQATTRAKKDSLIEVNGSLVRSQVQTQSVRHMIRDDGQLVAGQNISKTKSMIFSGKGASTATKQINGFGSTIQAAPIPQGHYQKSKGFSTNALRKGPNFSQMQYIASPNNEPSSQGNGSVVAKLIIPTSETQNVKIPIQNGNYNQMINFKSNLLSQQQNPHRSSSNKKLSSNSHTKMLSSSQRILNNSSQGGQGSNTLKQVAADEALAGLKHQGSFNSNPQPVAHGSSSKQLKHSNCSLRKGSAHSRDAKNQNSVSKHKGEGSATRRQQLYPVPTQLTQGKRNQAGHLQQQKSQQKLLTVESSKPSSFLTGQQQQQNNSALPTRPLFSGRSYENIKALNRQSSRGAEQVAVTSQQSHQHLRLRALKPSRQDSKH